MSFQKDVEKASTLDDDFFFNFCVPSKEICSDLVFCVNLGLLILSFLVEEVPHSAY